MTVAEQSPPPAGAPLTVVIRSRLAGLQPAMQRVAEFVVAHPGEAAGMTIRDLAARCGISETTVVRFCREVGLRGYPQLRLALAGEVGGRDRAVGVDVGGDIDEGDTLETVVRKIVALDLQAVADTGDALSIPALQSVVDALVAAGRVDIYGVGASGFVAADLAFKLHRIGRPAYTSSDPHACITSAALLGNGDVAIAISHSGLTVDTRDALAVAAAQGAITVAITNAANSPIAAMADHLLLTAARETEFRSGANASRLAQLIVVDCVFVGVAQRTFPDAIEALRATRAAIAGRRLAPRERGRASARS